MKIKIINRKTGEQITETPPAEKLLKLLYDNPFGKTALLTIARRKFISKSYGRKMNRPSSKKKIAPFVKLLNIDMSESAKKIADFTSFNDFFYRKLKPNARPIGEGFVSPGDGRILAFDKVSDVNNFFVKGRAFTLEEFLGNEKLAGRHKDSSMIILRLAPNDYHRYHFPYDGHASKSTNIRGRYYSVSPYALVGNFTKVFCENKRAYCTLTTKDKGEVVIAPVGATMVGSIFETYTANSEIRKGDEMGYFAFGGSTLVLLVEKGKIKIAQDILDNTKQKIETLVQMGETIAA